MSRDASIDCPRCPSCSFPIPQGVMRFRGICVDCFSGLEMECPFCGETGFDASGLKSHLLRDCKDFEQTPNLRRL